MISLKKEPKISIGILNDKKINIELYGEFKAEPIKLSLSGRISAELLNDKIIIKRGTDVFEFNNDVIFEPADPGLESFLIKDVIIGKKFHWERKEKERFTGVLRIIKESEKLTAINIIPIENYLLSVISSEMSAKSSLQLLKAHAIVSRSWLIAQLEKSKQMKKERKKYTEKRTDNELIRWYDREDHVKYDVCADDHCQRYQGITKIFSDVARQAIEQTRGLVLTYKDEICDSRYSKSCGGVTESYENVWEPVRHNYLTSVIDYKFQQENFDLNFRDEKNAEKWITGNPSSFCNTREKKILSQILLDYDQETKDFYRWTQSYTQEELSSLIKEKTGIDFGEIIDLIPIERGESSRIYKLKIKGTHKEFTIGKELEIRRVLSASHLYSSAFIVIKEDIINNIPQKFLLKGAGWGHGVGLCQIGAAVMASKGYQFDEMLFHYFSDAKLQKIY